MKYTPQQCRAAFYQAAANIEARPELYSFIAIRVGDESCPACMWGHVGRALGEPGHTNIGEVAGFVGFPHESIRDFGESGVLYGESFVFHGFSKHAYTVDPIAAAARLRAFADHHWPADSTAPVRPDLRECGQSFTELMDSLKGQTA